MAMMEILLILVCSSKKNKPIIGGTVSYLPPEAIKIDTEGQEIEILPKGIADPKIDSYSFGMTILAAITNDSEPKIYPPIIDENGDTIPVPMGIVQTPADYTKVMTAYMNEKNKEFNAANNPEHVAKKAILNVCAKLMTFDPKNRISCEEATKELLAIQTRY